VSLTLMGSAAGGVPLTLVDAPGYAELRGAAR